MQILQFFESIRSPALTALAFALSWLGNDLVLILGFCGLLWLADKRVAYSLCISTLTCIVLGHFLNLYLTVPRPYVIWPQLRPVLSALPSAASYAFPSGTTMNAVGAWVMASTFTSGWIRRILLILPVLVAVSRVYLGSNTALQVTASILLGLPFVWLVRKAGEALADGQLSHLTAYACAALVVVMLGAAGVTAPGSYNPTQALDCFRTMGAIVGLMAGIMVERSWIHFTPRAGWRLQVVKLLAGLGILGAIFYFCEQPLNQWLGLVPGNILRYALLFIWIVAGLPALARIATPSRGSGAAIILEKRT